MKKFNNAFTMAEALSVLILLGVVAAITIPTAINRQSQAQNKTKIKKALATYDSAVRLIVSENRITNKQRLDNFISQNNCSNIYRYFKAVESDGCQLKTSDGVWWDFGTNANNASISNTLIAFKREDLTKEQGWSETTNNAFYLHTEFDDRGSLRINDTQYSNFIGDISDILDCAKIYAFLDKKKMYDYYNVCQDNNNRKSCIGFDKYNSAANKYYMVFYNKAGKRSRMRYNCNSEGESCNLSTPIATPPAGWTAINASGCDQRGGNCDENGYSISRVLDIDNWKNKIQESAKIGDKTYTLLRVRDNAGKCPSTVTSASDCGTQGYDAIYTSGTESGAEKIYVQYTDATRTVIKAASTYTDQYGYWNTVKSLKCEKDCTDLNNWK